MEKRGDVARGCFESKSLGEKWEFRVMMVLTDWVARKWISSRRHDTHLFLEMLCILFPFGDYKWWVFVDDSFGSIIGISSCNGCGVVLHESSPFWPPSFIFSVSQFSHSVVSDSLWPHGLQHARPPCLPPTPGIYSNSCPLSQWASFLPKNTQDWSPLEWTGWISLLSKGLSRVFSNTTVQKHQFFGAQPSSQSNSHILTWLLEKP